MSPNSRWFVSLVIPPLITGLLVAGSAYAMIRTDLGVQEEKILTVEKVQGAHIENADVHLSISAAVSLERRLGSLEGEIKQLNTHMARIAESQEGRH